MKRLIKASGQSQVTNLDLSSRSHHDVGGFEISMQDPVGVEVVTAIEQLEHDTFDGSRRNRVTRLLGVVMNDLE